MQEAPIHLTLFLKYTTTLAHLDSMGILDREFLLYKRMQDMGLRMNVVSHGGRAEYAYRSRLPGMRILCNWIGWPPKRYLHRLHQLHYLRLLPSNVFKTDELFAGYEATRAARALNKPLIARAGYHLSHNTQRTQPDNLRHIHWVEQIERETLRHASLLITSAEELREAYTKAHPDIAGKSAVIPMHVDTERFQPSAEEKRYDLIYVGRFSQEKNVRNLLAAARQSGASVAMLGSGQLEAALRAEFGDLDGKIAWVGHVKNEEVQRYMAKAKVFILPSLFEGQPRALVEAMASGMPIIGTRVMGIASMLQHKRSGYLCETDRRSIAAAIQTVLAQPALMRAMAAAARQCALDNFALDRVAQREYELYQELLRRQRP